MKIPSLIYAGDNREILEHDELKMSASSGGYDLMPFEAELVPMPENSSLYLLSGNAIGFDMAGGCFRVVENSIAVAAVLPANYLRILLPSFNGKNDFSPMPYCAAGWLDGFSVAALKIDDGYDPESKIYTMDDILKIKHPKGVITLFNNNFHAEVKKQFPLAVCNLEINLEEPFTVDMASFNSICVNLPIFMNDEYLKKLETIFRQASEHGLHKAVRLSVMPGLTDRKSNVEIFVNMVKDIEMNLMLFSNMNYSSSTAKLMKELPNEEISGVKNMLELLKKKNKKLKTGAYFKVKK